MKLKDFLRLVPLRAKISLTAWAALWIVRITNFDNLGTLAFDLWLVWLAAGMLLLAWMLFKNRKGIALMYAMLKAQKMQKAQMVTPIKQD